MTAGRASRSGKRVPTRTCVVCRESRPKRQLTRLVLAPGGSLTFDPSGKMSGRGAYLCEKSDCWQRAARGGALEQALKAQLDSQDRARLQERADELEAATTS